MYAIYSARIGVADLPAKSLSGREYLLDARGIYVDLEARDLIQEPGSSGYVRISYFIYASA